MEGGSYAFCIRHAPHGNFYRLHHHDLGSSAFSPLRPSPYGFFLTFGARDISIHGLRGELLSRLNGLVFRQSDSMHYLVGSLILLFVILPLSLALMEKLYFSLYPRPCGMG